MNLLTPMNSLAEARSWLRKRVRQGTKCPCCQQHAKIYKRSLNSSMAHALVLLYRELGATGKYIHAAHFLMKKQATVANGGDYAKLVHFGLPSATRKGSERIYIGTPHRVGGPV